MKSIFKNKSSIPAEAQSTTANAAALAAMGGASDEALAVLNREVESLRKQIGHSFDIAVNSSVNLSELICLMAWSNGNVRTLSHETTAVSAAVEEIARSIENIAGLASNAENRSSEAHGIVQSGAHRAQSASQAMQDISDAFAGLDSRMQELGSAIENIGGFAKQIESISSQTKLLALNATIEAARAGEAGKGFAVVAAEVKQLSEETTKTTELIRQQLTSLAEVMQGMFQAMDVGGTKVRDGRQTFDAVASDMGQIQDHVGEVNESIGAIAGMLTDQQSATDSMAKSLTEIARLAGQNENDITTSAEMITKTDNLVRRMIDDGAGLEIAGYDVKRLRSDHMIWKRQLAECLVGLHKIDAASYGRNVQPFGPGYEKLVASPEHKNALSRLAPLHETLVREARKIVDEMSRGQMGTAIDAYMAMDKGSGEAMVVLAKLG
ncbi:Methyl-accepting chemotaxis protein 4 [Hartmannibacter diazotrophicus]|uniref:Methyl-accepting chemotaxis protein 4 n=1 Tax=Hartmannibacter diazotrophicus TaxID=1482074 RepID=A0A2C9D8H5_9HYPH|nr:methyl-accepting chemotaxis protein [Hartmannibacter diazotrophicus]SON56576.1 Methyl-accepting chemotaxis protein 4 [Hartmannibacter diazotrophicus]